MKDLSIQEILVNAKKEFKMIESQMQLEHLKSKVELALFIMKDNEWHHEESEIKRQVYMILENALKEVGK